MRPPAGSGRVNNVRDNRPDNARRHAPPPPRMDASPRARLWDTKEDIGSPAGPPLLQPRKRKGMRVRGRGIGVPLMVRRAIFIGGWRRSWLVLLRGIGDFRGVIDDGLGSGHFAWEVDWGFFWEGVEFQGNREILVMSNILVSNVGFPGYMIRVLFMFYKKWRCSYGTIL